VGVYRGGTDRGEGASDREYGRTDRKHGGNMEVELRGGWNTFPSFRLRSQVVGSSHMGSWFVSRDDSGQPGMDL
jgi:hypothetical protein